MKKLCMIIVVLMVFVLIGCQRAPIGSTVEEGTEGDLWIVVKGGMYLVHTKTFSTNGHTFQVFISRVYGGYAIDAVEIKP